MKTLYLMRHGKSDWDADFGQDHERPIAKRGRRAAAKIADFLAQNGVVPDRVLCSDALRTRQTLDILLDRLDWDRNRVAYDRRLYLASVGALYGVLEKADPADSVLVVGHQPTLSSAAAGLIGGGAVRVPTAALLRIDLDIDEWTKIDDDCGELIHHIIPKAL